MAAACYMAFGRLVWYISPYAKLNFKSLWVPPRWITPIFVSFDAVTFFIQMVGISAAATAIHGPGDVDIDQLNNGLKVAKIGLILQMICFLFFAIIGIHFLFASRKWSVPLSRAKRGQWQRLNMAINVAATPARKAAAWERSRIIRVASSRPGRVKAGSTPRSKR